MRPRYLISVLFIILLPIYGFAVEDPAINYTYPLSETTEEITIDGILSEKIWEELPVTDGFWMSYPVDDRRVEQDIQTELLVQPVAPDNYFD